MYSLSVEKRTGSMAGTVPKRGSVRSVENGACTENVQRTQPPGEKRGLNRVRTDLQVVDLHPSHIIVERAGLANELGRKCTG